MTTRKKLIEVALPLEVINRKSSRENRSSKNISQRCICNGSGSHR